MIHWCKGCRRVLRGEVRNTICLKCLEADDRNDFAEDSKTLPNIVPLGVMRLRAAA